MIDVRRSAPDLRSSLDGKSGLFIALISYYPGVGLEDLVVNTMQALPRAPASPARSENHRLLALAAPLVRGSAGALRRLLMLGLLKRFARFVALTGAALLLLALPQAAAASRTLSLAAAALPGGATILPAAAQARLPQPIYFWSNIPEPVSPIFVSNPLVIRPSTFLLFEDGQWVLQDMHWTGWGSRVASATGISSSSNDIPNAASGKRIRRGLVSLCRTPDGSKAARYTAASS